jgi:pimeloyl-ACP methyl ester carboxylesterase
LLHASEEKNSMFNIQAAPKTFGEPSLARRQIAAGAMAGLALATFPGWAALPPVSAGPWKSGEANVRGIRIGYVEQGTGPLVLLCHGFPELWSSWRHQIPALAAAGYRAVAPDLRGYGRTGGPKTTSDYAITELTADLVGLVDSLGEKSCFLVGHDFGAVLAWNAVLLAPDRFKAVAALSVPYNQRRDSPPLATMRRAVGGNFHYILYFQEPGIAEAELDADPARFLSAFFYTASGESAAQRQRIAPRSSRARLLETLLESQTLPKWLSEADFRYYVESFRETGFTGALNWYRNLDRNWELMKAYDGATITHPTLFVAGEHDPVLRNTRANFEALKATVPGLRRATILPGCGHWVQQECPDEVNRELISFLQSVRN